MNCGLPETFGLSDSRGYVSALYDSIILRGILRRHHARNPDRFVGAAYAVMQQFSREISCQNLAERVGISSPHTVQTHAHYLTQSCLVSAVRRCSEKPAGRVRNEKVYANAPACISCFTDALGSAEELGWRMENIIYLEMPRKREPEDYEILRCKDQSCEVGFCIVQYGKVVRLVQVACTTAGERTRKRELSALASVGKELGCKDLVVTTGRD